MQNPSSYEWLFMFDYRFDQFYLFELIVDMPQSFAHFIVDRCMRVYPMKWGGTFHWLRKQFFVHKAPGGKKK